MPYKEVKARFVRSSAVFPVEYKTLTVNEASPKDPPVIMQFHDGRVMGIGQVLTMPMFFASNAIYPLSMMPEWLRLVSHANPLTYEVDALRALMLRRGTSSFGLGWDFTVLLVTAAVMVMIAARLYPRLVT